MGNSLGLGDASRAWEPDADGSARLGHRPPENRLLDTATGAWVRTDHRSPTRATPE